MSSRTRIAPIVKQYVTEPVNVNINITSRSYRTLLRRCRRRRVHAGGESIRQRAHRQRVARILICHAARQSPHGLRIDRSRFLWRESTDSLRQIPLRLDVNYNWEGGKWHPFVGAGAGGLTSCSSRTTGSRLANLQPNPGSTSAEASNTSPAGPSRSKVKARYHVIGKTRGGQDPSGLVFTGGMEKSPVILWCLPGRRDNALRPHFDNLP